MKSIGNLKNVTVVLIIVGLTLSGFWLATASEATSPQTENNLPSSDPASHRRELELRLEKLLSSVEGVGEVEVMLTLESTSEQVFAQNNQSSYDQNGSVLSGSNQSETVLIEDGNREKTPILLYEEMPKIRGVAVVCEGAKDPAVCLKITQMISSLFGIRAGSVSVIH